MIRIRSVLTALAVAFVAAVLAFGSPHAAGAAKAAPSPSPSPAPSPTATPEPMDKQIPRLEAAVKANPQDHDSMTQLAADYMAVQRPDLAVALTQQLLAGGTKTAQIYYIDGSAQGMLGKQTEAIASMEQAANLEPTSMLVLQSLSQLYLRANRPDDAERVAKRGVTFNATAKEAFENYGFVLAAEKKYDDARTQFEAAAKLDPKDAHPVVLESRTYTEQNAPALAMQLLDRAITIDPTGIEALISKAELAGTQHDLKTALDTYEKILTLQTDDIDKAAVVVEEAKLYAQEKDDTNADATFRKAIAAYPTILQTHLVYGDYLMGKKDTAGGLREWNAGLGPDRSSPDALLRLGNYYGQTGDFGKAVDNFKRFTEVVPNDARGYLMLGQAQIANKDPNDARNSFKASYNLAHTPDSLVGLAQADMLSRNTSEAIQIYEALDKNAPDLIKANPGLLFSMGKAYQAANESQKAKGAYTRLLTFLKPNTQAYSEVKGLIASTGGTPAPAKPAPKPSPSAAPKH